MLRGAPNNARQHWRPDIAVQGTVSDDRRFLVSQEVFKLKPLHAP